MLLEKLISLRTDVRSYLNLFIAQRDQHEKNAEEVSRARKMMQLKKGLDDAITTLQEQLKNGVVPTTDTTLKTEKHSTPKEEPKTEAPVTDNNDSGMGGMESSDDNSNSGGMDGSMGNNDHPEDKPTEEHSEKLKKEQKEENNVAPLQKTVVPATKSISQSVGNKGKNTKEDTLIVQELLNQNGAKLVVDGDCGKATIAAIEAFQKKSGFPKPDGRVDPGGKTFEALLKGVTPQEDPTPTPVAKTIKNSVGNKGKNTKEDTLVVQTLLNQHGANLKVDGDCGKATITAITNFQKSKMGFSSPDGLVEPNGKTWKALNGEVTTDDSHDDTNNDNTNTTDTPVDTGSYSYYHHKDWESSNYVMGTGRTAKPLNATAGRLLRNMLAGAGIKSAKVTSTLRTYSDQAYIVLTQVTEEEAYKWYSWIRNNKSVFQKYQAEHKAGGDKEKIYAEYGEWIKKNVGLGASNHLSGIALDISGCDLKKFNAFATTIVSSSNGIKKVFPEPGRTHIEFTFKVT